MILLFSVVLSNAVLASNKAVLLNVNGEIGPAMVDYIDRGIQFAVKQQAPLIILTLDTPGGLEKSMRSMIESLLNSAIPIVVYVAPSGARAASAGTFIVYASSVAAMAPGTNIGAASPVNIGSGVVSPTNTEKKNTSLTNEATLSKKIANDAIAFIRSLAQMHNRNADFAAKAVTSAATLTAQEALQDKVIEIIAVDHRDLLKKLDGRSALVQGKNQVLHTTGVGFETFSPDWRIEFLAMITEPTIAYILLLIGIYGLFFEFLNPGFVLPGVSGGISLLLALYAFQLLSVNYVGLGLVLLGIIFLATEAFMPTFGVIGVGGIIAFIVGSIMLFDPNLVGYHIAWPLIFAMAIVNAVFFLFVVGLAYRARTKKIVSGAEELIGMTGEVLEDMHNLYGQALIHGEIWKIDATHPLKKGMLVRVVARNGLVLSVEVVEKSSLLREHKS